MTLKLRPYTSSDLHRVLHFLGKCFHDSQFKNLHPGDIIHWMSNVYHGIDLNRYFWIYEENNEILAFIELSKAKEAFYMLVTDPKLCDPQLEFKLIEKCQSLMYDRMKKKSSNQLTLSTCVIDSNHQRIAYLKKLGYHIPPFDMIFTLRSLKEDIPSLSLPVSFHIRSVANEMEAQLAAEVHNNSFSSKWDKDKYRKVMQTPGFDIEREMVVVAPDGRFAAFLIYWLDPISKVGLFEPVGCHQEFRRQGLTRVLMYEAMKRMLNSGMTKAIVGYNINNKAAQKLYTSVGFKDYTKRVNCKIKLDYVN